MNDKDKILNTLKEKGLELVSNIEEYKNRKSILKVKCLKCGKIFEKAYINIADKRTKSNCPRCGNRKTMTLEEVKDFYKEKGYEFLDEEYVNTTYLHNVKCPNGHLIKKRVSDIKAGYGCAECSNTRKKTYNEVRTLFEEEGYILLTSEEEYDNTHTKVEFICPEKHRHSIVVHKFIGGERCGECRNKRISLTQRTPYKQIKNMFESEGDEILSNESEYINTQKHLKIKCPQGHIYNCTPNNFQKGYRCNLCAKKYKGEEKVKEFLENNNINYEMQKTFKDCKDKQVLKFDFYLPQLNICIEYDGLAHFEPTDFAGKGEEWAKEQFKGQKLRDEIKNKYCKQNNINLLRIPYWEFDNIENILNKNLLKL